MLHSHRIRQWIILGRLPNFGSRPNTMGGKFPSVRPSTKSFFDFDEIWYTCSTRWEMKKVMTMPGSKVKVKVTSPWKSEIRPFSYHEMCNYTRPSLDSVDKVWRDVNLIRQAACDDVALSVCWQVGWGQRHNYSASLTHLMNTDEASPPALMIDCSWS